MSVRLLVVTDLLIAGGIERNLAMLLPGLKSQGFEIEIICLYGPKVGKALHFVPELEKFGLKVRVLDLTYGALAKVRGVLTTIRVVWAFRPDIVLAFNYHANLLNRLGRPFFPLRTALVGSVRGRYSPKQLRYERLSWRLCRKIVVNGKHLKDDLVDAGVPDEHVQVIPNGLDPGRFNAALIGDLRERHGAQQGRLFLTVGRITREKMFHRLVAAFGFLKRRDALLPEIHLWILGSPDEPDMVAALERAVAADDLADLVTIFPATDNPELFYAACDATILYSPSEGLPNVALESLAMGKPVLISDSANAAGVVTDGQDGWVLPYGDIEALANKIREVLTLSDETLQAMREACLRRARDFSVEAMVSQYSRLFRDLAGSRGES